jgi:hypothetical protein
MAGHRGPIIAAKFNPRFMHLRGEPNSQEVREILETDGSSMGVEPSGRTWI